MFLTGSRLPTVDYLPHANEPSAIDPRMSVSPKYATREPEEALSLKVAFWFLGPLMEDVTWHPHDDLLSL